MVATLLRCPDRVAERARSMEGCSSRAEGRGIGRSGRRATARTLFVGDRAAWRLTPVPPGSWSGSRTNGRTRALGVESGATRRLVRLADQRANEGSESGSNRGATRRLVRLADQRANEGSESGSNRGATRRLVRLADQRANE